MGSRGQNLIKDLKRDFISGGAKKSIKEVKERGEEIKQEIQKVRELETEHQALISEQA